MTQTAETTLVERLKVETKSLHTQVERSGVMADLIRGKIKRSMYCLLLRNLYEIYDALEAAMSVHSDDPKLAPICLPELARCAALADDLTTLHGPEWSAQLVPEAAATDYRQRLESLAQRSPQLLAAHAYVRYLGDLSGGQILSGIVTKAFQLDSGQGTHFYEFPYPGATVLKRRFRDELAALSLDQDEIDAFVAEAQLGFSMHERLFTQLSATAPATHE